MFVTVYKTIYVYAAICLEIRREMFSLNEFWS